MLLDRVQNGSSESAPGLPPPPKQDRDCTGLDDFCGPVRMLFHLAEASQTPALHPLQAPPASEQAEK